jgi:hypothetical protein
LEQKSGGKNLANWRKAQILPSVGEFIPILKIKYLKSMEQNTEAKNINLSENKPENMGLSKKIFLAIGALIVLFCAIQFINAAKYTMVVNVKDGENIMGINPLSENLDFGDLSRNNGMTRFVTFKNSGSTPVYIAAVEFGDISDLVKIDKNYFTLDPSEEVKISFEISIPPSAETRNYSGSVWIFRLPKLL